MSRMFNVFQRLVEIELGYKREHDRVSCIMLTWRIKSSNLSQVCFLRFVIWLQAYRDTSISGDAYLRNLVHMPFFLQNVSLRRVAVAQQVKLFLHWRVVTKTTFCRRNVPNVTQAIYGRNFCNKLARVFVSGRLLQLSLMCVRNVGASSEASFRCSTLG